MEGGVEPARRRRIDRLGGAVAVPVGRPLTFEAVLFQRRLPEAHSVVDVFVNADFSVCRIRGIEFIFILSNTRRFVEDKSETVNVDRKSLLECSGP